MAEVSNKTSDVFGVSRELPLTYVERPNVDARLLDNLTRDKHVIGHLEQYAEFGVLGVA
jgi:hypothetical protein